MKDGVVRRPKIKGDGREAPGELAAENGEKLETPKLLADILPVGVFDRGP